MGALSTSPASMDPHPKLTCQPCHPFAIVASFRPASRTPATPLPGHPPLGSRGSGGGVYSGPLS